MALHASVNRNTGFTPNQLMLGRDVILPVDIVMGGCKLHHQRVGSRTSLTKWQYGTVKLQDI